MKLDANWDVNFINFINNKLITLNTIIKCVNVPCKYTILQMYT